MTELKYRAFKNASWGIAIDIKGDTKDVENISEINQSYPILDDFYLILNINVILSQEEINYIKKGFYLALKDISPKSKVIITIFDVIFNPCDYQEEGLLAAFYEWCIVHFQIEGKKKLEYIFDKNLNKYIFEING